MSRNIYSRHFIHNFPRCAFSRMWWFCLCWGTVWCSSLWCELMCHKDDKLTSMSRQAALSRVIWSAMVNVVKPGSCLANSTVLMMHFVDNSLNLSQRLTSRETRCSELLFYRLRKSGKDGRDIILSSKLRKTPGYTCKFNLFLVVIEFVLYCWIKILSVACVPWCIFPADRGREMCPDGPGELVQSSALCRLTGRRSLPHTASSPPSSSSFCHFAPL